MSVVVTMAARLRRGKHLHIGPAPRRVRLQRNAWTLPLTWWAATAVATGFAIRHHPHLWLIPAVFFAISIGVHVWLAWQKSMLTHGVLTMAKVDQLKRGFEGRYRTILFHFKLPDGTIVRGRTVMPRLEAERRYRNRLPVLYRSDRPRWHTPMVRISMYEVVKEE